MNSNEVSEELGKLGLSVEWKYKEQHLQNLAGFFKEYPRLTWTFSLSFNNRVVYSGDYFQGVGFLPESIRKLWAKGRISRDDKPTILQAINKGKIVRFGHSTGIQVNSKAIDKPRLADLVHSLVLDASALDHRSFEEWATDLGYDTDSRKAEAIYNAYLKCGLALRNAIPQETYTKIVELVRDL